MFVPDLNPTFYGAVSAEGGGFLLQLGAGIQQSWFGGPQGRRVASMGRKRRALRGAPCHRCAQPGIGVPLLALTAGLSSASAPASVFLPFHFLHLCSPPAVGRRRSGRFAARPGKERSQSSAGLRSERDPGRGKPWWGCFAGLGALGFLLLIF